MVYTAYARPAFPHREGRRLVCVLVTVMDILVLVVSKAVDVTVKDSVVDTVENSELVCVAVTSVVRVDVVLLVATSVVDTVVLCGPTSEEHSE